MKKHITAALILSAAMAVWSICPAYAADAEIINQQARLAEVKQLIDIPDGFDEMNMSVSESELGTLYTYTWSAPEGKEYIGSLTVSCDEGGHVVSYSLSRPYKDAEENREILSADEICAAADQAIRRLMPYCFGGDDELRIDRDSSRFDLSNSYSRVVYRRYKTYGGSAVPVADNCAYVTLSCKSGVPEVTGITLNRTDNAVFTEDKISCGAEEYKALAGELLQYRLVYSGNDKKLALQYVVDDAPYMNTETGEAVKHVYPDFISQNRFSSSAGGAESTADKYVTDNGASQLSEQEIKELDTMGSLITAAEGEKAVRAVKEFNISDDLTLKSSSVYKSDKNYLLSLRFDNGSDDKSQAAEYKTARAVLNAVTGKFVSVYAPYSTYASETEETDAPDGAGCEDFLAANTDDFTDYSLLDRSALSDKDGNICVTDTYARLLNGVPFINDEIRISYSGDRSRIYSLSKQLVTVPDEVPDPADAVSADEAYNTIFDMYPLHLIYVYDGESYRLVYGIDTSDVTVNAITNQVVGYNGKPIEKPALSYSDISGHWAEKYISLFAERGLLLPGDEFMPDSDITTADFIRICKAINYDSSAASDDEDLIAYAKREFGEELDAEDLSEPLTRETAARRLVTQAGYKRIAEAQDIFICPFSDSDDISPELTGYCAIAKALSLINGDNGAFLPANRITRAEAVMMMYNYKMNV